MTGAGALGALLERVEAATGPDQELDAALTVAFDIAPPGGGWLRDHAGCFIQDGAVIRREYADGRGFSSSYAPARFTTSLDAAVALVGKIAPNEAGVLIGEAYREMSKKFGWHMAHTRPGQLAEMPRMIVAALLRALIAQAELGRAAVNQAEG